jgi:hypothetical protein
LGSKGAREAAERQTAKKKKKNTKPQRLATIVPKIMQKSKKKKKKEKKEGMEKAVLWDVDSSGYLCMFGVVFEKWGIQILKKEKK